MWFLCPKPSDYSDNSKDLWLSLFSREITSCKSNRSRDMTLEEPYYCTDRWVRLLIRLRKGVSIESSGGGSGVTDSHRVNLGSMGETQIIAPLPQLIHLHFILCQLGEDHQQLNHQQLLLNLPLSQQQLQEKE